MSLGSSRCLIYVQVFINVVFALAQSFDFDIWLRSLENNHNCCDMQELGPFENDLALK